MQLVCGGADSLGCSLGWEMVLIVMSFFLGCVWVLNDLSFQNVRDEGESRILSLLMYVSIGWLSCREISFILCEMAFHSVVAIENPVSMSWKVLCGLSIASMSMCIDSIGAGVFGDMRGDLVRL